MKKEAGTSSQKQIIIIMLIVILPLIAVLITYNIYTVNRTNYRVFESSKNTLNLYQSSLENDLQSVENLMVSLCANDIAYRQLNYVLNPYDANSYAYDIIEKYKDIMFTYPIIGGMFICTTTNQLYRETYSVSYDIKQKQQIVKYIKELSINGKNYGTRGWFCQKIGGHYFLFRILGKTGLYTICMVDPEMITKPHDIGTQTNESFILYTSPNGYPITSADKVKSEKIDLTNKTDSYYITGENRNYFITHNYSDYANMGLTYLEQYHGYFQNMDTVQTNLLILTIILVLLFPVAFLMLNHSYFQPLGRLINTMECVKSGDLNAKMLYDYKIKEFQLLSTTFNEMVEEIKNLKIESYEKELEMQQAQLRYLQLQIKPHFYLNCLKNICGMAQEKKYIEIQKMVIELSGYLRYMLQDNSKLVLFSKEIENTQKYISLQQMGASNPPICIMNIDESLINLQIPPLSILTFVENSIKYGACQNKQLIIKIKAVHLESDDDSYANVTISDNGNGFSNEMLRKLNLEEPHYEDGHFGIANVKHRFQLIYHGKSIFSFSNQIEGSCIEIFIPFH